MTAKIKPFEIIAIDGVRYHPGAIGLPDTEQRWCKQCDVVYPSTKKYFYLSREKPHGHCKTCAIKLAGERQKLEAARRNGLKSLLVKEKEQRMHDNRLARIVHSGPTEGTLNHQVFCRWEPTEVERIKRYECI